MQCLTPVNVRTSVHKANRKAAISACTPHPHPKEILSQAVWTLCVLTLTHDAVFNELLLAEVDEGLDVSQGLWGTAERQETPVLPTTG